MKPPHKLNSALTSTSSTPAPSSRRSTGSHQRKNSDPMSPQHRRNQKAAIQEVYSLAITKSHFFHTGETGYSCECYYRPQRSWAKVIFLEASVCPQGGVLSPGGVFSPGGVLSPRGGLVRGAPPPPIFFFHFFFSFFFSFFSFFFISLGTPPQKQTQAYGQRAASTHPTGMHSCVIYDYYNFNARCLDYTKGNLLVLITHVHPIGHQFIFL